MGWVTAAMLNVLKFTVLSGSAAAAGGLDLPIIIGLFAVVGIYSTISGLWGVVVTDFLQFLLAMTGCVALAFFGVGYLLGGGLFTRTTGRVVRLGLKIAAIPMVRDELLTLAESAVDGLLAHGKQMNESPQGNPDAGVKS